MWVRSTGLGKRNDLLAEFEEIKRDGDYWILCIKTLDPVRWKIRVAMTPQDLRELAGLTLQKAKVLRLSLDMIRSNNPTGPPEDY